MDNTGSKNSDSIESTIIESGDTDTNRNISTGSAADILRSILRKRIPTQREVILLLCKRRKEIEQPDSPWVHSNKNPKTPKHKQRQG